MDRSKKRKHRNESLDIQFTAVLQIYPGRECLQTLSYAHLFKK